MANVQKRKLELSAASVALMLLVIFIHVVSEAVTSFDRASVQYAVVLSFHRLSSFAVQGFIFLSGLKLFLTRRDFSAGRFYLGRIRRVVLPYIAAFTVFFVYFVLTRRISRVGYFSELAAGGLVGHFYFVVVICQFYLLMPLWRLIVKKCSPAVALPVALVLMIICGSSMPEIIRSLFGIEFAYNARLFTTYLFYFVAGAFAGASYDSVKAELYRHRRGIYALSAAAGAVDCLLIWMIYTRRAYPSYAENVHVLYCISAIAALFCLSVTLTEKCGSGRLEKSIVTLDLASYNVYLIHPLFIFITESILYRLVISSISLRFAVKFVLTYALSIGICVLWEMLKAQMKKRKTRLQ